MRCSISPRAAKVRSNVPDATTKGVASGDDMARWMIKIVRAAAATDTGKSAVGRDVRKYDRRYEMRRGRSSAAVFGTP
jgi:hypothetical protein